MELRHLKYFKTVAEELHFGKAAARLNMAQPPLSIQIRQLEEEIGVLLFHRTKRNVELTEEGKILFEKVYQLLENLDEAIETVRMLNRGEIGEIVVGFIATAAYDVLPTIIKHYRQQYPGIHVVLKQLTSSEQLKALQEGTIQIAILSEPIESEEINFEVIKKEPLVIALPKEHPFATETSPIDLISLANEPFILTGRKANQNHYDAVINCCYLAGFSPKIEQETEEVSTVLSLVAAGIGIALVPASMQLLLKNEVVYRDITDSKFNSVTALAWVSKNQSSIVQAFIELARVSVIPFFKQS